MGSLFTCKSCGETWGTLFTALAAGCASFLPDAEATGSFLGPDSPACDAGVPSFNWRAASKLAALADCGSYFCFSLRPSPGAAWTAAPAISAQDMTATAVVACRPQNLRFICPFLIIPKTGVQ